MIFIIGGFYSGKTSYAREQLGISAVTPYSDGFDAMKSAKAVSGIHLYIRELLAAGKNPTDTLLELLSANPNVTLISDEIGCGIVPLERKQREWREAVGRTHCFLAEKADTVIRVVCGIGKRIK